MRCRYHSIAFLRTSRRCGVADHLRSSVALPQYPKAAMRLVKAQAFKAKVFTPRRTKPLWQHYAVAVAIVSALTVYAELFGEHKEEETGFVSYASLAVAYVFFAAMLSRGIAYLQLLAVKLRLRRDRRKGRVKVFPSKLRTEITTQLKSLEVNLTFQEFVRRHPAESVKMIDAFREWERETGSPDHSPGGAQHLWAFVLRTTQQLAKNDKQSLVAEARERATALKERFPLPPAADLPTADVPADASSIDMSK